MPRLDTFRSCEFALLPLIILLGPSLALAGDKGAIRIAVMEFQNGGGGGGEVDALGKGLQSMVTTDLASVQTFKLVERARLSDIQGELKLAKSGAVDKKTAVQIGKLAGASHLLTGTFTIVGNTMRIDSRLFAVQSGDVLLAEKSEGEKDAFFELEKALVGKLITAVGVKLAPKERADVGRVHTADFAAFSSYSHGLQLFDDKQYDQAMAALRDASSRDKDFKLATLTLDEYQRLISKIETRADGIVAAQQDLERANRNRVANAMTSTIDQLYAIAGKSGASAQPERLAAIYELALALGNIGRNQGQLLELRRVEDQWAMQRNGDGLVKSYFSEAVPLFPRVPVAVTPDFSAGFPSAAAPAQDLAKTIELLYRRGSEQPENRRRYLLANMERVDELARRLQLDERQRVVLEQQLFDLGMKLAPSDSWKEGQMERLAKNYRAALMLDRSTALWAELSRSVTNPNKLKGLADEIATNKRMQELLDKSPAKAAMREYMILSKANGQASAETLFTSATLTPHGAHALARLRELSMREYVLIGAEPVWPLLAYYNLSTGARTDGLRASELRYFLDEGKHDVGSMVAVGGAPRKDFTARFVLSFAPGADWWPQGRNENEGVPTSMARPEVGFLFGMRDVDCEEERDPKTQQDTLTRPLRALMVVFAKDALRVVEVVESKRTGAYERSFTFKTLASAAIDLSAKSLEVTLAVAGDALKATINGKSVSLAIPKEHVGFTGLRFSGSGFAALHTLKIGGSSK